MAEVPVEKDVVAALPQEGQENDGEQQHQAAAAARSSSSSSSSSNNNGRRRNQTQQQPPRQAMPPLQKELKKLPKEVVKALPGLKTPENFELALKGKPIKWKEHSFFEAFHVVRMEQTIGTKKRVEVSLSLEDYQKMPKRTKAFYKFNILAVSYVLICKTCKHPRNPLIVNPEMKRKRPNTRRGTEAGRGGDSPAASPSASRAAGASRSRSKSVGAAPEDDFIEQVDPAVAEEMEREREERRRLRRERREKRAAEEKKKQEEAAGEGGAATTEEKKEGGETTQQDEKRVDEEKKKEEEDEKEEKKEEAAAVANVEEKKEGEDTKEEKKKEEEKKEETAAAVNVEEQKQAEDKKEEKQEEKKPEESEKQEEAPAKEHRREKKRSSAGDADRSKGKEREELDDAERRRSRPAGGGGVGARAQDKVGGITPRAGTPNAPNMNAEIFSKQNNPYEYNSYDVYVEPCSCAKCEYNLEFLLKTEISNKVGVSIGMLLLNLPTMGVAFALYSDGPVMQSRKMFAFDLLSTHEQNMSIKTVL